jgi:hypothetical protein
MNKTAKILFAVSVTAMLSSSAQAQSASLWWMVSKFDFEELCLPQTEPIDTEQRISSDEIVIEHRAHAGTADYYFRSKSACEAKSRQLREDKQKQWLAFERDVERKASLWSISTGADAKYYCEIGRYPENKDWVFESKEACEIKARQLHEAAEAAVRWWLMDNHYSHTCSPAPDTPADKYLELKLLSPRIIDNGDTIIVESKLGSLTSSDLYFRNKEACELKAGLRRQAEDAAKAAQRAKEEALSRSLDKYR